MKVAGKFPEFGRNLPYSFRNISEHCLKVVRKWPHNCQKNVRKLSEIFQTAVKKLLESLQKNKQRPVFAVKYDPRLPSITNIQTKHWRSMTFQDKYMEEVFPQPPLTAFERQRNLRDILIRAKVPPPPEHYSKRILRGMS